MTTTTTTRNIQVPFMLLLIIVITVMISARLHDLPKEQQHQLLGENDNYDYDALVCRVLNIEVYGPHDDDDNTNDDRLECEVLSGPLAGHSYKLELPHSLMDHHQDLLRRGAWYIQIPQATIEETYIPGYGTMGTRVHIPNVTAITTLATPPPPPPLDAAPSLTTSTIDDETERVYLQRRDLTVSPSALGTRRLLVVRVSTDDASPTYTATQLSTYYFDMSSFSMARQYYLCSCGLLHFVPYSSTLSVLQVQVSGNAASFTKETLVNAAISMAQDMLGNSAASLPTLVQHVAFILPPGLAGGNWFATGQVGAWRSVYNDKFGGIPDTSMHEIGHNFGLGHAGTPGDQYGDETSLMGYGDFRQFAPSKCFNACDHYNLKWFSDRTIVVNPTSGQQVVTLAAFVDYRSTSSSQFVVLMIGTDYCLSYNVAKGVNAATQAAANQVSVTRSGTSQMTTRVGILDETTSAFQVSNYRGGSQALVVKVCDRSTTSGGLDYALVALGVGSASCTAKAAVITPTAPTSSAVAARGNPSPSPPTSSSSRKGVFINAGTSNSFTDLNGVVWLRDLYYSNGGGVYSTSKTIANTSRDRIYQTQRWGNTIQYQVPLANGQYQVTLLFAEIRSYITSKGARVFDVYMNGAIKFKAVDVYGTVGSFTAMTLTTSISITDGSFSMTLIAKTTRSAILSAFSVKPM